MDLSEYRPTRNWKPRVVWWAFVFILIAAILTRAHEYSKAIPVLLISAVLIDEWIKEGYFFKVDDLKKPGTHEFITVVMAVAAIVWGIVKRRKRE